MKKYAILLCCLWMVAGCGSTVPRGSDISAEHTERVAPPDMSRPADVAVLPFENRTGNKGLNWLRTAISATVTVRLKEQLGWTTLDGAFVRQTMADQEVVASGRLTPDVAIGLSGGLFAESLITGYFEGREKDLTISAVHISGETGQVLRSATRKAGQSDRNMAINRIIMALTTETPVEPLPVTAIVPRGARTRTRVKIDRHVELPEMFNLETTEQIDDAIRTYRRALDENPEFADAHFALGYAYDKQGNMDKALMSYRQAVTLNPLNADYLYSLGYTYERKKELRQAVESYEAALAVKPDDVDVAFALGYAHEQLGQYAEAIEAYKKAIELKPDDYDAYYGLATTYESSGQLNDAFTTYQQVVTMNSENIPAYKTLGAISVKLQRWDAVIDIYNRLIKENSEDVDAHRALADAYKNTGRLKQAISTYQQITRLTPKSSASFTNLGNLYVKNKQYDQAITQYRQALKVNPKAELVNYNLGNVLVAQKQYRAAIDAYVGYLRIAPKGKYAQKARDKVEDLRFRIMSQ